ncbi:MAG: type II asparaginase [Planctomycetes bacterium]|nr:type II asparaginase [Planctomycetota bacterium]
MEKVDPEYEASLPHAVILATGGTIAGTSDGPTEERYHAATLSVDELLCAVPQVRELAHITGEQVSQVGSQDMDDMIWLDLARRTNAYLARDDVDGVVVTHGTDTLEETAFFLQLTVVSSKPVVLTGAMRPATGLSADGPRNILDAVRVAISNMARERGVLAVLDESIFSARGIAKTSTIYVSSFKSPNFGPTGAIVGGWPTFFRPPISWSERVAFDTSYLKRLPRVDVIFAHAGQPSDLVELCVERGAEGLVLAGVGNGNASRAVVEALTSAAKAGIVVVRSSRVGSGFVTRNIEIDDDLRGFVAAEDLSPQKARILLQLALTRTKDPGQIQEMFEER